MTPAAPRPLSSRAKHVLDLACAIQQIPAPTFHERARAEFVRQRLVAMGLGDVEVDEIGNVFARRPGGSARSVLVTAHTDTVFPLDTPLTLRRAEGRLSGPGIGDNSLGVAGLLALSEALGPEPLPGDVWLAANTAEEGLGNLAGMRRVIERLGAQVKATVVIEGMSLGRVYHRAIAVRRFRISARTEGGHSWTHFGRPSAIHALIQLGAQITQLPVPAEPKTTFNIGMIGGGTSINTIAREASLELDLRSADPAALDTLAGQVHRLVDAQSTPEAHLEAAVIGERPSGAIPREHPLVEWAARCLIDAGLTPSFDAGSTDANLPLSLGLPCVCLGLTRGGNAHRPDEYIETAPLDAGLMALANTVRGLFDLAIPG